MSSALLARFSLPSRPLWSAWWAQKRHLARSLSKVHQHTPRSVTRAVSPLLVESVEKRLARLRQEVDLGLGPVVEKRNDVLQETLIKAMTIEHVKELIATHYRNMDPRHVSECMQTIESLVWFSEDPHSLCSDLLSSKEFLLLANRSLKIARHMEPNEALRTLFVVHKIGVSIDTLLSQALLQIVRYSINEYSINELHQLVNFINENKKTNPAKGTLVDAILLALPHALKNLINYKQLNFDNAHTLLQCLRMIEYFGTDRFSDLEALGKCLRLMDISVDKLSLRDRVKLLSSIYSLKVNCPESVSLIKRIATKCIDSILSASEDELNNLPNSIWSTVLRRMRENYHFYNPKLFHFISRYALSNASFNDEDRYFILLQNWNFKFVDFNLLDHFAQMLQSKDSPIFGDSSRISPVVLLRFFALPSERHQIAANFNSICENIISSDFFKNHTKKYPMEYFNLIKNSVILNVTLDEALVKSWFAMHLQSVNQESTLSQRRHFLKTMAIIYQAFQLKKNLSYSEEMRQFIIEQLNPINEEYISLLKNELLEAPTMPLLEELHLIAADQLTDWQLRKNFITNSGLLINLLAQRGEKMIGFLFLDRKNYCREPAIIDGDSQFELEMIANCKIDTIVIDLQRWKRWSGLEKSLFIKSRVESVLCE